MADRHEWATVVVPLDTSGTAEAVLPWAALLARDRSMGIRLLAVWDKSAPIPGVDAGGASGTDVEAALRRYLEAVAAGPAFVGLHVTVEVRTGDVVDEIRAAGEHPGNLIILASHGQGGYVESRLGSVAERLMRRIRVPILIVPAENRG
jgi:nucleotide-binding universal stress UspA family protein